MHGEDVNLPELGQRIGLCSAILRPFDTETDRPFDAPVVVHNLHQHEPNTVVPVIPTLRQLDILHAETAPAVLRRHDAAIERNSIGLLLDLLLEVNFEGGEIMLEGKIYECSSGQSLKSLEAWADRWKWSRSSKMPVSMGFLGS